MITVKFTKLFIGGFLVGLTYEGSISFVDRWHAEDWLRGVSANSLNGKLDFILVDYVIG